MEFSLSALRWLLDGTEKARSRPGGRGTGVSFGRRSFICHLCEVKKSRHLFCERPSFLNFFRGALRISVTSRCQLPMRPSGRRFLQPAAASARFVDDLRFASDQVSLSHLSGTPSGGRREQRPLGGSMKIFERSKTTRRVHSKSGTRPPTFATRATTLEAASPGPVQDIGRNSAAYA